MTGLSWKTLGQTGQKRGIPQNKRRESEQIGRKRGEIGANQGEPLSGDPQLGAPKTLLTLLT